MENVRFAEYLAVFVEVCRLGSFSAAARRRSVTHSSIVRQIDALEADLGVPLLTRPTRAVSGALRIACLPPFGKRGPRMPPPPRFDPS